MKYNIEHLSIGIILFFGISTAIAQDQPIDSVQNIGELIIKSQSLLGSKYEAQNRTGSASYLSKADLERFGYTNMNNILLTVPGVNLYEEDGFGLRPNISLRGTSPERSAKITLMEDGVLIAPAPYSSPAAYYSPNIARMSAVEVLKGSSQVQYGPFTTGGAINFVSSQIPDSIAGSGKVIWGNYNTRQVHTNFGERKKQFGYFVEYLDYNSDGFKSLQNGGDTGFDRKDFMGKFMVNTKADAKVFQSLTLKLQYAEEESDETYLGLTDQDFGRDPFKRYLASAEDVMNTEHDQVALTHILKIGSNFKLTTTAYHNNFKRNWYKLNDVMNGADKIAIADIINNPTDFPLAFDAISSGNDTDDDVFIVRANNRSYFSRGVQTKGNYTWGNGIFHDIEIGLRIHQDEEDRFQWEDKFKVENSRLRMTTAGIPGTQTNRVTEANAVSAHLLYKLIIHKLTLTPGLRYENVNLERRDFGTNDIFRLGTNLNRRVNNIDQWIPGIGAHYKINQDFSLFGGVHKGFAPPGTTPNQDPEESTNYELGSRFNYKGFSAEITGYYNDYSNLLGSDLAAAGGGSELDLFNAGSVDVRGIEMQLGYDFLKASKRFQLPVILTYTFTDTEFNSSFDSEVFGSVQRGDEIPFIVKNQLNVVARLEAAKWGISFNARYQGEYRNVAGSGSIPSNEKIPSAFVLDFSGRYRYNKNIDVHLNIINVFDNEYAVSRQPAGLRPGHPFGISAGLAFHL